MSNTKHTPIRVEKTNKETAIVSNETENIIAFMPMHDPNAKANAERIVRCWNSHDELLEALRKVNTCLDEEFQSKDELVPASIVEAYEIIEAAIKKATE